MNKPGQLVLLSCFFLVLFTNAVAQTAAPTPADKSRSAIDETFYLNIIERRFIEQDFKAGTVVSTDSDSGLDLQVGVGLSASKIDVHMRNIRGTVRFQGTLERILRLLRARQPDAP